MSVSLSGPQNKGSRNKSCRLSGCYDCVVPLWKSFVVGEDEVRSLDSGNLHHFLVMFANEMCFDAESSGSRSDSLHSMTIMV